MKTNTLGLYLHIPFCVSKCSYCDFYSLADPSCMDAYLAALQREIAAWGQRCGAYAVDTVYFGGGTPSHFGAARLSALLQAVRQAFTLTQDAEVTVECNPESTDEKLLGALRDNGANRLSFGVQSASDEELRRIGRAHDFAQAQRAVRLAQQYGFSNISLDLMYGLPAQRIEQVVTSAEQMLALAPTHLSCYGLKVEANTPMGRENPVLPDEDAQADMYLALCDLLRQAGFEHYEISNWAKPEKRSRHNQKYWDLSSYLGLGPGAHSCLEGKRFAYPRSLPAFLADAKTEPEEQVPHFERQGEYIMLCLRTADGLELQELQRRFGVDPTPFAQALAELQPAGLTAVDGSCWRLTEQGFLVSNAIIDRVIYAE